MYRPPKDDDERMQNLLEALSEPGDEPDAIDEIIQAQLAKRGHTMETYAAELQAKTRAVLDRHRRARRARWIKRGATAGTVLALAAGVLLYYVKGRDMAEGEAVQPKLHRGCACEVASASSRGREIPPAPAAGLGLLLALLLRRRWKRRPPA
jgi:MYXO-CTERM domain-containing protein